MDEMQDMSTHFMLTNCHLNDTGDEQLRTTVSAITWSMKDIKRSNGVSNEKANVESGDMLRNVNEDDNEQQEDFDTDEYQGLPIDRGWAWAVLAGVAMYLFLFGAVRKNFGLFFVAFQERYNTNASVTSLVATIQNIIISVASLLVMTVGMHFMRNRTAILIGGIIKTMATLIAGLSTDVSVLFLSIGVLDGIGISLAQNPTISMLGEYFNKKRGMANGLVFCAASLGAIIFAPILTTLFQTYGYVGTMLIAAGMSLNTCVTGVVMRPISSFVRNKKQDTNGKPSSQHQQEPLLMRKTENKIQNGKKYPLFSSLNELQRHRSDGIVREELFRMNSADPVHVLKKQSIRNRTFSENSQTRSISKLFESLTHSNVALYASTTAISAPSIDIQDDVESALTIPEGNKNRSKESGCLGNRTQMINILQIIFDTSLFKNGLFPCILIMGFMLIGGGDCVLYLVPPHAKDIGLSSDQRGILLLLFGCFDLFGRIILTVIADRDFMRRTTILGIAASILGLACHLLRFFDSFGAMVAFSIIVENIGTAAGPIRRELLAGWPGIANIKKGSFSHLYWALHAVIVVDYLTAAKLKSSLGFMTLCHGSAIAVVLPISGAIRDSTGTYVATYHMLGCILFIGAAMAFSLPYVDKYVKNNAENVKS